MIDFLRLFRELKLSPWCEPDHAREVERYLMNLSIDGKPEEADSMRSEYTKLGKQWLKANPDKQAIWPTKKEKETSDTSSQS